MNYWKKLKICKKLYGNNVRFVGKTFIWDTPQGGRKVFYIYYKDSIPVRQKIIKYSVYKMEKKLGRLLKNNEEVHHGKEGTLCDKYRNLKVLTKRKHASITHSGNKYWLGKFHTEKSKRKMSLSRKKFLRKVS